MENSSKSFKEQRVRKITQLYYSRPDIQEVLFDFSKNREVCPRYFEGFGKRPDALQYPADVFELVKKGATSFHCSEELWSDALQLETGLSEEKLNNLRIGWDLLIDIDSKYLDYSKILTEIIIGKQTGALDINQTANSIMQSLDSISQAENFYTLNDIKISQNNNLENTKDCL